jgi:hypothetical protein
VVFQSKAYNLNVSTGNIRLSQIKGHPIKKKELAYTPKKCQGHERQSKITELFQIKGDLRNMTTKYDV